MTGRYAVQGAHVRAGLELWAARAGAHLQLEDDRSDPARAASLHRELRRRGCRFVLGPYGGDSTRAVAQARAGAVVWNHGAASDDVQRLPGVVSVPSPASRYLVALGHAVAALRPGAAVAIAAGRGRFARLAADGLEDAAPSLGLEIVRRRSLDDAADEVCAAPADVILACGPIGPEVNLLRAARALRPDAVLGGVSPGVHAFASALGASPDGFLAPVQWHPDVARRPQLGPSAREVLADAAAAGIGELDYVGAQAYAAALVAERCLDLDAGDPRRAARHLRTTTFFGPFALGSDGGQAAHRLSVVRWRGDRREVLAREVV